MTTLTAFNNQLASFLEELIDLFPKEKQIIVMKEKIELLRKANPRLIVEGFVKYALPYREYIVNKDESYFLDLTKDNKIDDFEENKYVSLTEALNLRNLWTVMDSDSKEAVWKYFQILVVLSERWQKEQNK